MRLQSRFLFQVQGNVLGPLEVSLWALATSTSLCWGDCGRTGRAAGARRTRGRLSRPLLEGEGTVRLAGWSYGTPGGPGGRDPCSRWVASSHKLEDVFSFRSSFCSHAVSTSVTALWGKQHPEKGCVPPRVACPSILTSRFQKFFFFIFKMLLFCMMCMQVYRNFS